MPDGLLLSVCQKLTPSIFPHCLSPSIPPSRLRSCDCIRGEVEQGQGEGPSLSEAAAAGHLDSMEDKNPEALAYRRVPAR